MTLYSMTGYASVHHSAAGAESTAQAAESPRLSLEIRSVNSRFLDLAFKLPESLRAHEPALRQRLLARLKRGKVELRATLEQTTPEPIAAPTTALLQRLGAVQQQIQSWLPQARALSVAEVLRLCGSEPNPTRHESDHLLALTEQALAELLAARQREGARLADMLQERIVGLRALAAQAQPLIPQLLTQQRERFLARWQEATAQHSSPPELVQERALTEATAFAMRADIAEELSRINAHLDELEQLLQKGGEVGKRLDFLAQELHREANTLGAKSTALALTHISVDMKVLIEQIREQVQNIE